MAGIEFAVKWRLAGVTLGHTKATLPIAVLIRAVLKIVRANASKWGPQWMSVFLLNEEAIVAHAEEATFEPVILLNARGVTITLIPAA